MALGKFFQSALVESNIPLCQVSSMCEKQEATTGAEAPDSVVLVSSHPDTHVFQSACLHPVFWEAITDIQRCWGRNRNKAAEVSSEGSTCNL